MLAPSLLSPVSSRFTFVFALPQFSGPNYLGAWNRLDWINKEKQENAKSKFQSDKFNARFINLVNKDYFAYNVL